MPRRTIYVRAEDEAVWKEAEGTAGESLSALVTDALRSLIASRAKGFLEESEGDLGERGFVRVELPVRKATHEEELTGDFENVIEDRPVAFFGKALAVHSDDFPTDNPDKRTTYRAYLTSKGKLIIYRETFYIADGEGTGPASFRICNDLDEAVRLREVFDGIRYPLYPRVLLRDIATATGESWAREIDV